MNKAVRLLVAALCLLAGGLASSGAAYAARPKAPTPQGVALLE
jgi:hypothetical protein